MDTPITSTHVIYFQWSRRLVWIRTSLKDNTSTSQWNAVIDVIHQELTIQIINIIFRENVRHYLYAGQFSSYFCHHNVSAVEPSGVHQVYVGQIAPEEGRPAHSGQKLMKATAKTRQIIRLPKIYIYFRPNRWTRFFGEIILTFVKWLLFPVLT